jgi:arylsulfatase A-like enzyme
VSSFPARLIDIAPTVLALAGGSHASMRGIVLADALHSPLEADVSAETTLRPQLDSVVGALRTESALESKHK